MADLDAKGLRPANPDDEYSYDSDEYPKYAPDGGGEADTVWHCGSGEQCLNAIELADRKVGAWLENDLTADGREYVQEFVEENPEDELMKLWAEWYDIDIDDDDNDDDE